MTAQPRKRKSFGSAPAGGAPVGAPPIELEIYGKTYLARGEMPGVYLMDIIRTIEGESESDAANAMLKFLEDIFLKRDREAAMSALRDTENVVPMGMLQEIIYYLIGEYTGNPTAPAASSTSGSDSIGSGNTEEPSVMASTSVTDPNLPWTESATQPSSPVSSQRAS